MVRERVLQRFGIGQPEAACKSSEHAQFAAQCHDRNEQGTDVREHATSQEVRSFSAERMTGHSDHRETGTSRSRRSPCFFRSTSKLRYHE